MSMASCPCSIGVTADAAQPAVRRRAVIRDPLVVEPRESRSEIRVFEAGHAQPEAGIEHHRVDVVAVGVADHTLGRPAIDVGCLADPVLGRATGAGAFVLRVVAALEHQPQPLVGAGFDVVRPALDRLDRQRGVLGDVSIGIDDSHVPATYSRGLSGQTACEVRHDADVTTQRTHRRSTELVHCGDAGLDDGRLRLLHRGVRLCRYRKDFPPQQGRSRVRHHGHPGHAPGRRAAVRALGRPGRPAASADGGRDVLLRCRVPVRVRAELHRAGDPAAAVRHWHGRRMGAGRRARHGEGSRRAARLFLRAAAGGLRVRLSAGEPGLAGGDELAGVVVALVVRPVHHPGPDQPDHPVPGAGVRGLGSRPGSDEADQHQDPRRAARRRDHPPVHSTWCC